MAKPCIPRGKMCFRSAKNLKAVTRTTLMRRPQAKARTPENFRFEHGKVTIAQMIMAAPFAADENLYWPIALTAATPTLHKVDKSNMLAMLADAGCTKTTYIQPMLYGKSQMAASTEHARAKSEKAI
eukprot:CAMPEP_0115343330 /NCGR_PEP_ID=MMETSP0270-20121206/92683_1 /TAXON_ID=71861 /ORGANISM="Scrippsiella trochoidea, Strain CCMP3099" /LENGTH=126 /DNA_ID=CAMNT_0002764965 /DNA_START=906 /DNA_END=1286 /DNA_ORIENTATION=-